VRSRRSEIRGKLICKEVSREPLSRNAYHLWPADFLAKEIGRPEHIETFLERGLGRSLFSKRFSPDYLFENAFVLIVTNTCDWIITNQAALGCGNVFYQFVFKR
jgi:hypothetical protein